MLGLAKTFVQVFPQYLTEKPELMFWPTRVQRWCLERTHTKVLTVVGKTVVYFFLLFSTLNISILWVFFN